MLCSENPPADLELKVRVLAEMKRSLTETQQPGGDFTTSLLLQQFHTKLSFFCALKPDSNSPAEINKLQPKKKPFYEEIQNSHFRRLFLLKAHEKGVPTAAETTSSQDVVTWTETGPPLRARGPIRRVTPGRANSQQASPFS